MQLHNLVMKIKQFCAISIMKIPSIYELKRIGNERIKTSSTLWHCCISVMEIFEIHTLRCRWKVTLKNNFHDTKIVQWILQNIGDEKFVFPSLCNFVINFCDWQWAICARLCAQSCEYSVVCILHSCDFQNLRRLD